MFLCFLFSLILLLFIYNSFFFFYLIACLALYIVQSVIQPLGCNGVLIKLSIYLYLTSIETPLISRLRKTEYHTVLNQYKSLLKEKRKEYYHAKISELEKTADNSNSRSFWNCLKSMDDSVQERSNPPISEESWMSHFESLHSNEPLNSHHEATRSALHRLENATHPNSLDYLIFELEIRTAAKKLKKQ